MQQAGYFDVLSLALVHDQLRTLRYLVHQGWLPHMWWLGQVLSIVERCLVLLENNISSVLLLTDWLGYGVGLFRECLVDLFPK